MELTPFDLDGSLAAASRQTAGGAVKIQEDLDRYAAVIGATSPDLIIECGTFSGKSARWFAARGVDVVTIDTNPLVDIDTKRRWVLTGQEVTQLVGSSTHPSIVQHVHRLAAGRRVMVVLDSDHSAGHVANELAAYAPLVPVGGYCVVEDTLVRWMPWEQKPAGPYTGSPLDAVEHWLAEHHDWEIDRAIEAMTPVTQHPSGWLRRCA